MFDRDGEFGEVAVADDAAELAFGFEHAGGGPAEAMSPGCQRLTLRLVQADALDHRLARVGRGERRLEAAADPEPLERERLLEPLAQGGGSAGVRAVELGSERSQPLERGGVVVELPGRAEARA